MSAGVLQGEHELLGATFETTLDDAPAVVQTYLNEQVPAWSGDAATLTDLSGGAYLLVSGPEAESLMGLALAGRRLEVGETRFSASLSGSGETISVPLALRTGDNEFVVIDPTPRGHALSGWLRFLAGMEQGGVRPFPNTTVEDASSMLVPLLLVGGAAPAVLGDYVHGGESLPVPGRVSQIRLDSFVSVVAGIPLPGGVPAYLVLVSPPAARPIWRSLLSFTEVHPVGHRALAARLSKTLPWGARLDASGPVTLARGELAEWGLLRPEADFIGARGL